MIEPPRITYYLRLRDCEFEDRFDLIHAILSCAVELRRDELEGRLAQGLLPDSSLYEDLVSFARRVFTAPDASDFLDDLDKFILGGVCRFMQKD